MLQHLLKKPIINLCLQLFLVFTLLVGPSYLVKNVFGAQDLVIFDDSLSQDWQNWSWNTEVYFNSTDIVKSGTKAVYFSPQSWGGLYFRAGQTVDLGKFAFLNFSLFSFDSYSDFYLHFYKQNEVVKTIKLSEFGGKSMADQWKDYSLPLSLLKDMGVSGIDGFAFQETEGRNKPAFFLDEVKLQDTAETAPSPTPTPLPSGSSASVLPTPTPTSTPTTLPVTSGVIVFQNGLAQDWENWSWGGSVNLDYQDGSWGRSILFETQQPWAGLYLHTNKSFTIQSSDSLTFRAKVNDINNYKILLVDENGNNQATELSFSGSGEEFVFSLASFSGLNLGGIIIQDKTGSAGGRAVFTDIMIGGQSSPKPSVVPTSLPTPSPSASVNPPVNGQGYQVSNGSIFYNNAKIQFRGVSWFGFETGTHVPHGLWLRNWQEMTSQIKQTGFNALRVPFCPSTLKGVATDSINYDLNPDLQNLNSLQVLDKFMEEFNKQQIYVLLDHHNISCSQIEELWYADNYSEEQWIADLKFIAERYKHLPYFMGIDIKNEPHGQANWGSNNQALDWKMAAEKAGQAVLQTNPNLLIFVQGVQENPTCSQGTGHWMGGNLEPQACYPCSSQSIPANKLVLSPHVYGPDVYVQGYFNDPSFPQNMPAIWEQHFGYLAGQGFTLVPGEWGGKYGNGGDPKDKIWQDSLKDWFKSKNICNSFYWSWNPNSGDTGGVLQDDWQTIWPDKVRFLQDYFNNCSY